MGEYCSNYIYSSTNSLNLFELERYPKYYTLDKQTSKNRILKKENNGIGPTRNFIFCIKNTDINLFDASKFNENDYINYILSKNVVNPMVYYENTYFIERYGVNYVLVFERYFIEKGFNGIIENDIITIFNPENYIKLESIESNDNYYPSLVESLQIKEGQIKIEKAKIMKKYDITDELRLNSLILLNYKYTAPIYKRDLNHLDTLIQYTERG